MGQGSGVREIFHCSKSIYNTLKNQETKGELYYLENRSKFQKKQLEELKLSSYLQGEGLSMGRDGTITYHFLLEA